MVPPTVIIHSFAGPTCMLNTVQRPWCRGGGGGVFRDMLSCVAAGDFEVITKYSQPTTHTHTHTHTHTNPLAAHCG